MADHHDLLTAIELNADSQAQLADLTCGTDLPSELATAWAQGSGLLESIARGSQAWFFENHAGAVVGFGAVGPAVWNWPQPSGSPANVVLIPMFGVDQRFHGLPPDPAQRYAFQIMSHLVGIAQTISRRWPTQPERPRWLVLLVHRDNRRAIRFYERCGFELIPNVVRRNGNLVMKLRIDDVDAQAPASTEGASDP